VPQLATARQLTAAQHSLRTVLLALNAPETQLLAPVATTVALAAVTLVASVAHSVIATIVVLLAAQIAPLVK